MKKRIHFMGHLDHKALSKLYGIADLSIATSVFPEAFGFVVIESLASGSMPVATYHSGFRCSISRLIKEIADYKLASLKPGIELTSQIATMCSYLLYKYPTKDWTFRNKLHEIAKKSFSWQETAIQYLELASKNQSKSA